MSLLFSEITYTDPHGQQITFLESGHPDEYDMRELLGHEPRYARVRKAFLNGGALHVRHYMFRTPKGRDWLAEQDHFALMDAYDALARRHGEKPFVRRGDVSLLEEYRFTA